MREATRSASVALVPELTLRTTDDVITLWRRTERHLRAGPAEPPFWAFAWAGGQAVARYLLDHPQVVRGRAVLDLGCGGGLVAVAAARAGGEVTAVDVDPLAIAATRLNAAANGVAVTTVQGELVHGALPEVDLAGLDVVLAGDVFYSRTLAGTVLPFLRRAARTGCDVLVGDPGRAYLPLHELDLLARYDVPVSADLEGVTRRAAAVYTLSTQRS